VETEHTAGPRNEDYKITLNKVSLSNKKRAQFKSMKINDLGKVKFRYVGIYDGNSPPKWQTLRDRQREVHTGVEPGQQV
jgi:hypothetical protein